MFDDVNAVQLTVFTVLFAAVSVLGFVAARWRRADDLEHLDAPPYCGVSPQVPGIVSKRRDA